MFKINLHAIKACGTWNDLTQEEAPVGDEFPGYTSESLSSLEFLTPVEARAYANHFFNSHPYIVNAADGNVTYLVAEITSTKTGESFKTHQLLPMELMNLFIERGL